MTIQPKQGDVLNIRFEGRLDINTAEPDEAKILANLAGVRHLVIDCEKLNYVSSAGLRMLVSLQKKLSIAGGGLKLIHVCPDVMDVFDMTGFTDILSIEKA